MLKRFGVRSLCLLSIGCLLSIPLSVEAAQSRSAVKRIASHVADLGKPHELFLVTGMVTLIILPDPISRVTLGNENDYKYSLNQESPDELVLKRVSSQTLPTNLIVKAGGHHYDFDIHPSNSINQDIFEVTGYYGGPEFEDQFFSEAVVIDSSEKPTQKPKKDTKKDVKAKVVGS